MRFGWLTAAAAGMTAAVPAQAAVTIFNINAQHGAELFIDGAAMELLRFSDSVLISTGPTGGRYTLGASFIADPDYRYCDEPYIPCGGPFGSYASEVYDAEADPGLRILMSGTSTDAHDVHFKFSPTSGDTITITLFGDYDVRGVPEPATWALMIFGFGAVGGVMRYRRREATVRFA